MTDAVEKARKERRLEVRMVESICVRERRRQWGCTWGEAPIGRTVWVGWRGGCCGGGNEVRVGWERSRVGDPRHDAPLNV